MDPVSDIIALLRPHAVLSKPISGRGRWGVRYEPYKAPSFCVVLEGQAWLMNDGDPPRLLERGDFFLQFYTPGFSLVSEPGAPCKPGIPSAHDVRHGAPDGPPEYRSLGGAFRIEETNTALLGLLTEKVHIRARDHDTSRFASLIALIADEVGTERLGRDMVLERLIEILLVESLRASNAAGAAAGLLAGLRDASISNALRALHADVRGEWTVATLAEQAAMSRSAFAAKFTATLGCAPMEYLARWRMSLAQDALARGGKSLDKIAEEIGYESASAFSTAFRKRTGVAPGAFARARRALAA